MRAFAITGIETTCWISSIFVASAIRATPPSRRMSAGTRSSAMTAHAPASSAIFAWSAVVTSMMTPPFNISANPDFTRKVPVSRSTFDPSSELVRPVYRPSAGDRRALLGGRRMDGARQELDPCGAGREGDDVAGLRREDRDIGELLAHPAADDHRAVPEDPRLAGADDVDLRGRVARRVDDRAGDDLDLLHDDVRRLHLVAVVEHVRDRAVGSEPR